MVSRRSHVDCSIQTCTAASALLFQLMVRVALTVLALMSSYHTTVAAYNHFDSSVFLSS